MEYNYSLVNFKVEINLFEELRQKIFFATSPYQMGILEVNSIAKLSPSWQVQLKSL